MKIRSLLLGLMLPLALAGCGIFREDKPPPLPGERLAIIQTGQDLQADPAIASRPLDLLAPVENESWPQPGGSANHAGAHLALPNAPKEAWRISIGEGQSDRQKLLAAPVVANNTVYVMDAAGHVSAIDLQSGAQKWRVSVLSKKDGREAPVGGIAFDGNKLFTTNGRRDVMALDPENGGMIWRYTLPTPARAAPSVADGRVYVVTMDNQLIAINAENGEELWRHSGISEAASVLGAASPAIDGELVVAAYSSGELYALRPENGMMIWSDSLSQRSAGSMSELSDIRGKPVIDQDLVVAVSYGGKIAALDRRLGERVWQQDISSSETPLMVGQWIFILSQGNQLMALDRLTGKIRMAAQLPQYEDPEDKEDPISWTGPVLANGQLWVYGSNGHLLAIDADQGTVTQTIEAPGSAGLTPVIAQSTLLLLTAEGDLIAYR